MCTNSVTKQPHKHAALIKAWADGAEIEYLSIDKMWYRASTPSWDANYTFRIKPEPKPDVVRYGLAYDQDHSQQGNTMCTNAYLERGKSSNVQYTFDGETGKLKAVELIK